MKKWLSALLLVVLLIQSLPVDALASIGRVLSREELDRAYALTGLGDGDGAYHKGMAINESVSGMQLVYWLEERLDTKLHSIEDILARVRFRLDALQEKYPAIYRAFAESPYYSQVQALTAQTEALHMELSYQLERIRTDINMISQMGARLEDSDEAAAFDSDRVRASARIESATEELTALRAYIVQNAEDWDAELLDWTNCVQVGAGSETEDAIAESLRRFLNALWQRYNLGEGSDEAIRAELRRLLRAQFIKYVPDEQLAEAFADDAIALIRDMWVKYNPEGDTGLSIIGDLQTLLYRLYEKYGQDGADDAALVADVEALMRELWRKYGPGSAINSEFVAAWRDLMVRYGLDSAAVEAFAADVSAMLEDLWNKYGPDGEGRDALLSRIRLLWSSLGASGEGGVGQWISSLFIARSEPVAKSAPVVAVTGSNSRMSRLSAAAGIQANDQDATVTVITKDQICISLVTGIDQSRVGVSGVSVQIRDATKADAPLSLYHSDEKGNVILPTNLFVADKYEVIHLYVEVDPRPQGYRNFIIEDLDLTLGGCFMGTLTPVDETAPNGPAEANAAGEPYIVSGSFNGKDIMQSEYEMIYSPVNGKNITIKVLVNQAGRKDLPDLMMSWYQNEGGFSSIKKHWAEATSKTVTAEGYTQYTFKGPWKQKFSPNASKKQRPAFSFGKDEGALTFPTQLVALRSATDAPINEGTGAEGGVFGSVLGKGFSLGGFTIPVVDVGVSLSLPFTQYWPRLSIDPAGFVAMWVGCPIMEQEIKDLHVNWESQDMKEFRRASEFVEKEGWFANYKAQFGLASDFYREKKWKFLGQSKISVGIFAVGTGRWELDSTNPDVKTTNVQVALGFGMTATYEYSWTISYPVGPVPVYVCFTLGVSAGVAIQFTADFCWTDSGFANWKLYPVDEITYSICFFFAAQLGVGVKGFLEAYVRFVGSFDIMIRLVLFGVDHCSTEVSCGITLSTGVTVFFVKFSKKWISKKKTLFSTVPAANLLEHYMNEEANEEKVVEAAHLDPQSYPGLTPTIRTVFQSDIGKADFKVLHVGGTDYIFFLTQDMGADEKNHWRVSWTSADRASSGSTQQAVDAYLPALNGYEDYAFDVHESNGLIFLSVACAKAFNADGLPEPNVDVVKTIIENRREKKVVECNQIFYLLALKRDSKGRLTHVLDKGLYARSDKQEDHFMAMANPVGAFASRWESYEIDRWYYYDSITTPEITWARVSKNRNTVTGFELFGTFGRVAYEEDDPAHGVTSFEMMTDKPIKCFTDEAVQSGLGADYVRTSVRGAMRCSNTEPGIRDRTVDQYYSPSFVALSRPRSGEGDRAIEVFDFEMNGVNDHYGRKSVVLAQGDIQHYELMQTAIGGDGTNYRRMIFYTEKETAADGAEQCRLYGLYLDPVARNGRNLTFTATKFSYDLVIPDGQFKLIYMGETPYIYWMSALPREDEDEAGKWRVWIVAYDVATNTMNDAAVFLEFELPEFKSAYLAGGTYPPRLKTATFKDTALYELNLMGGGTSYFSMVPSEIPDEYKPYFPSPMMVCSVSELLTPVVDLKAAITQAPAVAAGSFENVSLAMMNEGNLGIATFDIAMYEVVDERESLIETVHVNCVDRDKSKLTMSGGKLELSGRKVAYRSEDFDYTARQRDWVLSQEKKQYNVYVNGSRVVLQSVQTLDSDTQYVKSDVLMPGSIGVYNTSFKIPEKWEGEKKLRFKVKQLSVQSNMARAVSNAAGGGEEGLITYVLDERTDRLVLQRPVQGKGGAADDAGYDLYARSTQGATLNLMLSVHDLSATHRVYNGWDGQTWLDITVHNYAAFGDNPKLSCAVYLDGASDPYYVNLPYFEDATANRMTQTISIPLTALVDDPSAHNRARVEVNVVGREDCAFANNEFTVYLGGSPELQFTKEIVAEIVRGGKTVTYTRVIYAREGETVAMHASVSGGTKPYRYHWQVYDQAAGEWVDLKDGKSISGANADTLTLRGVRAEWDGRKARCVVTDAVGATITSDPITLRVARPGGGGEGHPDTGDHASLPLYLTIALIALALLIILRRRDRDGH